MEGTSSEWYKRRSDMVGYFGSNWRSNNHSKAVCSLFHRYISESMQFDCARVTVAVVPKHETAFLPPKFTVVGLIAITLFLFVTMKQVYFCQLQ
jgi:hypothetical protein